MTRQRLWRILTGREAPDAENDAMRRGTECEPVAVSWYETHTGEIVTPVGFVQHPVHDFLGVSPDGYVGRGRIEVKCPVQAAHHEIPAHYMPQCVGVLHLTFGDWLDFISWHPDGPQIYQITAMGTRDQWQKWETELVAFWNDYVLADVEPPRRKRK